MKAIVCVSENNCIGRAGQLIYHLKRDLANFKEVTMGHTVIMGRKTLETLPGKKPLTGRDNIILSRDPDFTVPGATVVHSVEEALAIAPEDSFVIGGESVYEAFLPYCDEVCLTRVFAPAFGDAWFPELKREDGWWDVDCGPVYEEGELEYRIYLYRKDYDPEHE